MPAMKQDLVAFDRAASARTTNSDGHMRVLGSVVSMANVCDYMAEEIPDFEALGLKRGQVVRLYRDAKSLADSAESLNGKPLLILHRAVTADDHAHELVVGALDNAKWDAPFLRADITIWDESAIAAVESGAQRELSCGYRYVPVMEPGMSPDGEAYDGVMTQIQMNHCALVSEARVQGAFVGDSAQTIQPPKKEPAIMAKVALSRKALLASGALRGYMQPKLAADAAPIDFGLMLKGVTAKNWKSSKPKIKTALDAAVKGKLATDADIGDIVELLDQLDDVVDEVADTTEVTPPAPVAGDDDLGDDSAMDGPDMGKMMEFLKGKLSDADMATVNGMCGAAPAAEDAELPEAGKPVQMTKGAMDAALKAAGIAAAATAKRETVAHMNAISEAIRVVRPHVGEIVTAMDSAAQVYKFALDAAKVDLTDVPEAAYPALVRMLPLPGATPVKPVHQALDAKAVEAYAKKFPHANRLVR